MTDVEDDSLPEWTDEELAVLRTADDDRPPGRSLAATLAAVGAGGAAASAAAAAKGATAAAALKGASAAAEGATVAAGTASAVGAAKATGLVVISKWVGVAALGGAVVTGGIAVARHENAARQQPAATRSEQPQVAPSHQLVPPAPAAAAPAPEPAATVEDSPGAVPAPANPAPRASVRAQPDITAEIAALDEARRVLRAGRPVKALAALDRYDARYARGGSLRVEATALRIEALLGAGRRDRATSLASSFLARYPKSPYAARVRTLLGEPPSPR